ncbi:hypothetical protein C5167_050714 [Papaver somniferum]|uniref:Uncharacterized protein n=1 Tax=Papaver somniferum TaxID=3469 RepID=A0A4Y7KS93_PAPSO|nr:hypothetical protein C5167_050714 [Papaver somniferum]
MHLSLTTGLLVGMNILAVANKQVHPTIVVISDCKIRTSIDFGFEFSEFDGLFLDYSWQCGNQDTMEKLLELAEAAHLKEKVGKMYSGKHINSTEDRSVLHVALRAPRDDVMSSDGINIGATGKALKDVVAVGIGVSVIGCKKVLQSHPLRLKHFVPAYDLDMDFVLGVGGYDLDSDTLVAPSHMEYAKLGRMEMWQHTGSSMEILMPCANDMGLIPNVLIENFDDDRWYESNGKEL